MWWLINRNSGLYLEEAEQTNIDVQKGGEQNANSNGYKFGAEGCSLKAESNRNTIRKVSVQIDTISEEGNCIEQEMFRNNKQKSLLQVNHSRNYRVNKLNNESFARTFVITPSSWRGRKTGLFVTEWNQVKVLTDACRPTDWRGESIAGKGRRK